MSDRRERYTAIYSAKAARFGTVFWRRADGSEVEVTAVCGEDCRPWRSWYAWDDAEERGEVVEFIGRWRPDPAPPEVR